MAEGNARGEVQVVYALAERQWIVALPFVEGLTALEAVRRSGLLERFPEITERSLVLGIFGIEVEAGRALAAGDRVEICRPLPEDPRAMRRHAVARGQTMGTGSSSAVKTAALRGRD